MTLFESQYFYEHRKRKVFKILEHLLYGTLWSYRQEGSNELAQIHSPLKAVTAGIHKVWMSMKAQTNNWLYRLTW